MSMYFVEWHEGHSEHGVPFGDYENAVVEADSWEEAKLLVEKKHHCEVKWWDIRWIHHPLKIS